MKAVAYDDGATDTAVIDQLRRAVYAHFPARDIRAFEELLRRYAVGTRRFRHERSTNR